MSSDQIWFVKDRGKEQGPFNEKQLKQLAESGRITPESKVRHEAMGRSWMPATKIQGLFASLPQPVKRVEPPPGGRENPDHIKWQCPQCGRNFNLQPGASPPAVCPACKRENAEAGIEFDSPGELPSQEKLLPVIPTTTDRPKKPAKNTNDVVAGYVVVCGCLGLGLLSIFYCCGGGGPSLSDAEQQARDQAIRQKAAEYRVEDERAAHARQVQRDMDDAIYRSRKP